MLDVLLGITVAMPFVAFSLWLVSDELEKTRADIEEYDDDFPYPFGSF